MDRYIRWHITDSNLLLQLLDPNLDPQALVRRIALAEGKRQLREVLTPDPGETPADVAARFDSWAGAIMPSLDAILQTQFEAAMARPPAPTRSSWQRGDYRATWQRRKDRLRAQRGRREP